VAESAYSQASSRGNDLSSRVTEIAFPGGRIVGGRIRPDRDTEVVKDEKNGGFLMRLAGGGPGVVIDPCECSLETGGSCLQVSTEENGTILEIWCEDDGCGFCVGGVRPEAGLDFRLRLTFARA
jgi:hypothetical protein